MLLDGMQVDLYFDFTIKFISTFLQSEVNKSQVKSRIFLLFQFQISNGFDRESHC